MTIKKTSTNGELFLESFESVTGGFTVNENRIDVSVSVRVNAQYNRNTKELSFTGANKDVSKELIGAIKDEVLTIDKEL